MRAGVRACAVLVASVLAVAICCANGCSHAQIEQAPHPVVAVDYSSMVRIEEGCFSMGSNDGSTDETPVHKVCLSSYFIDKTEVTTADYQKCIESGKCTKPILNSENQMCNSGFPERTSHPINCVSHDQASTYCRSVNKRLPTEAEWEFAARGSDGRTYPWGEEPSNCSVAIINSGGWGCGKKSTWPVGSKPEGASAVGVLNLGGNVREWVSDWYAPDYYASSPITNPTGPATGQWHVLRGGSWLGPPPTRRATARRTPASGPWIASRGFRCAADIP